MKTFTYWSLQDPETKPKTKLALRNLHLRLSVKSYEVIGFDIWKDWKEYPMRWPEIITDELIEDARDLGQMIELWAYAEDSDTDEKVNIFIEDWNPKSGYSTRTHICEDTRERVAKLLEIVDAKWLLH